MHTDAHYDLAIIGGGYRATALLAAAPELRRLRTVIVERRGSLGGGAFHDYNTSSTSTGDRFLKDADSTLGAFSEADVKRVTLSKTPLYLPELARVLDAVGRSVLASGPLTLEPATAEGIHLGTRSVGVRLEDGRSLSAEHVVLATGRHELPSHELQPWLHKTVLSSRYLGHSESCTVGRALANSGPLVIAGCSHSAMSALRLLLERREAGDARYANRRIVVTRRSLPGIYYSSIEHAFSKQVSGRERLADTTAVCRHTGVVHRDSGLRGDSMKLYIELHAGQIDDAEIVDITELTEHSELLDNAALIVQALGYVGRSPLITSQRGNVLRTPETTERLPADAEGRTPMDERLTILRVDPTPPELRDYFGYGQGMNKTVAARILDLLDKGVSVR